jgi:hypothetical protein
MTADPRALAELLEESQDLQADALRPTQALDELVETAHARREDDQQANKAFYETHTRALTSSLAGAAILGAAGGNRHDGSGAVPSSWSWAARCSWPRAGVAGRDRRPGQPAAPGRRRRTSCSHP